MRSRVWGVPSSQLFGIAMLPIAIWFLFRGLTPSDLSWVVFFRYFQFVFVFSLVAYFCFTLFWIYLFKRGLFYFRYLFYAAALAEGCYEIASSIFDRNFGKMFLAILALVLMMVALFFGIERKVHSASLNPEVVWYEGHPKTLPGVKLKIKVKENWFEAGLRRADRGGFFVFLKDWNPKTPRKELRSSLYFSAEFRGFQVEGPCRCVAFFLDRRNPTYPGLGLQFLPKDLYHFSQYTGWVEKMKGQSCFG